MEASLNAALKTGDTPKIFAAIDKAVHAQSNIKKFALKAGVDRIRLYRTFRSEHGPKLNLVLKVLDALGFRFVVKSEYQPKITPNRFALSRKLTSLHLELRSNPKLADHLTRAFESSEIDRIVQALSDALRAQENVVDLAAKTTVARTSLYRAFAASHVPNFSTVVSFLHASGLRLAVKSSG